MNEPLKDKIIKDREVTDYFLEKDVKSAVEWLKQWLDAPIGYFNKFPEQLNEFWRHIDIDASIMIIEETYLYKETFNLWIINRAFPDLCPSGDLIADKQNPQENNTKQ